MEINTLKKKPLLIGYIASQITGVYFIGLPLLKSEKQAKCSLPFISTTHIIFNKPSPGIYYKKKPFLKIMEECNFFKKIILKEAIFDSKTRRIQLSPDDIFLKNDLNIYRKRTLFNYLEDISGHLPRFVQQIFVTDQNLLREYFMQIFWSTLKNKKILPKRKTIMSPSFLELCESYNLFLSCYILLYHRK